jgi:hydrogenase small subunit
LHGEVPSGWAREQSEPNLVQDIGHRFYDRFRRSTDTSRAKAPAWGKREEWTEAETPAGEREA